MVRAQPRFDLRFGFRGYGNIQKQEHLQQISTPSIPERMQSSIQGLWHDGDGEDEADKDEQEETQSVPEQNIGNQSKKIPPMAAQIPRRPRPEHGPRPPRPRRRSTVASPKGPQSDAAWRGRVAPGGGSEDGHRSGAAPAPTAAPFLSRRHVCSNELVGFSGVVAGTASGRAMPPS